MARLAASIRGGYFPAHPVAVAEVLKRIRPLAPGIETAIIDPCAGKGDAIKQIAWSLGVDRSNVYAIELDEARGESLVDNIPRANILQPASALAVTCRYKSFGLAWVNPPYGDEIGGGERVEAQFADAVGSWLVPKGIMVMVVPERTAKSDYRFREAIRAWYDNVSVVPFPQAYRPYGEMAVIGERRQQASDEGIGWNESFRTSPAGHRYDVPVTTGPGDRWFKSDLTEAEYVRLLNTSELMQRLEPRPNTELRSAPLPPGEGHLALLLASGQLNGLVCPPGESPHVVRGTVRKEEFVKAKTKEHSTDKAVTKTVFSERIVLTVRAVWPDGQIRTFTDKLDKAGDHGTDGVSTES